MRFKDKVAVVTGGAAGIGYGVVEAFAKEGAAVVIVDVNAEHAKEAEATIKAVGGKALAVQADVSSAASAEQAIRQAVEAFGGVDYLVNNAGVQTYGTVLDMDEATWDRTINVNLKGIFLMSKYAVAEMLKRGGGAVVNMASVQGISSQRAVVAYSASKGGAIAITRTMALDHAPQNIRVNAVAPGSVDTPLLRWAAGVFVPDDPDSAVQDWGKLHALGRVAQPSEIAGAVLFLCSDDASFVTGTTLVVDGGLSIQI